MSLGQSRDALLNGNGGEHQLPGIGLAATKFVPQPQEAGMLGQRVPAESLNRAALALLDDPQ